MSDPAIISSLELEFLPEPPRIVEERTLLSSRGQAVQRVASWMNNGYAASVDSWLKSLSGFQAEISKADFTADHVGGLTEMITEAETFAEQRAIWRTRFAKRSKQAAKARFKEDPSLAVGERDFAKKLLATDARVIKATLEYALFLRALRSTVDPEAKGGPAFDDPGELERYLRNAVAASGAARVKGELHQCPEESAAIPARLCDHLDHQVHGPAELELPAAPGGA